jgi:hypothetical protein
MVKMGKNVPIMLDYTSDLNRQEQMSLAPQHVVVNNEEVQMTDNFRLILVQGQTGKELSDSLLTIVDELGLHISNCMGHRHYDIIMKQI